MKRTLGRKVSILLLGSVLAQALPLCALPLLSRLYSPDLFGQFGIFMAASSILASLANLKYDHGVLLARNAVVAFHVFALCFICTATLAGLLGLVILSAPDAWFASKWFAVDRSYAAWLPVTLLLAGLSQALTSMLFRGEQFAVVAKVRIGQALISTVTSLVLGFWMPTGMALVASSISGQVLGIVILLLQRDRCKPFITPLRWSLLVRSAVLYQRFPIFTAPSDMLNSLGANLPMLFIGSTYGLVTAGAFTLAQRTLGMPLMLIGSAFSDAYRQSSVKSLNLEGCYWNITVHTLRTLCLIAFMPAIASVIFAPLLFPLIFGAQWALTGVVVQMLTLPYFLRLVVSPLTYNYYLANRHSEDLILQCLSFVATITLFIYAQMIVLAFKHVLLIYGSVLCSIYIVYGVRSLYFAKLSVDSRRLVSTLRRSL